MSDASQTRLTKLVKRFLDTIWYILIFAAVAWPITVIVIGFSMPADPELRHADVNMFLHFKVDSGVSTELMMDTASSSEIIIQGRGDVQIQNTQSVLAWYLSGAITEIMAFIGLFGLLQMRRLFASLAKKEWFEQKNSEFIRNLGYTFISWHIALPLLQYFGGRAALNDIQFNVPGIYLFPGFEFNVVGIFAGLAILVMSGVLREAADIHYEQSLTI